MAILQLHIPINITFPIIHQKEGPQLPWTKDQLLEAFKRFDLNGDGKLSREELKKAFQYIGSRWGGFRAGKAISHADADNSGFVELNGKEMDILVLYASHCGYTVR